MCRGLARSAPRPGELRERERVRLLRRLRRSLVADPVEEAASSDAPSARSRSRQSCVRVLEADREPEQAGRHARALPARPRLDARRDAAEARHVRDQLRRRLDAARGLGVGDVEGEEAAEPGIADRRRRPGATRRRSAIALALAVWRATRTSSVSSPRRRSQAVSAAGTGPVRDRNSSSRAASSGSLADDGADERVVVPGEVLRRRVDREVAAELERADVERRRSGRVAHDARGMRGRRLEVRHRQERVRRRLEPDEVDAVGRRARLVELDLLDAPAARARRASRPCRSSAPSASATVCPGESSASTTDVHAAAPEEKSSASPPSSSPSRARPRPASGSRSASR